MKKFFLSLLLLFLLPNSAMAVRVVNCNGFMGGGVVFTTTPTPVSTSTATVTATPANTSTRTSTATPVDTATATFTSTATPTNTAVGPTSTPTTSDALNWTNSFIAVWQMEEATDASRLNSAGTSCGSSCDLIQTNTVDKDTTNKVIGTASASFDGSSLTDDLACLDAQCGTFVNVATSMSWGYFGSTLATSGIAMRWAGPAGLSQLSYNSAVVSSRHACRMIQGDGTSFELGVAGAATNDGAFHAISCVFDDGADTFTITRDGGVHSSGTTVTSMISKTVGQFDISAAIGGLYSGNIDEAYLYGGVLSTAAVCRICSCGINAPAAVSKCTCSGTNFVGLGRNAACNNCTLPAVCNAATP